MHVIAGRRPVLQHLEKNATRYRKSMTHVTVNT